MGLFADRVRECRIAQGFSVRDLGRLVNRSPGYISRLETTNEIPSAGFTIELATALKSDAEELLALARSDLMRNVDGQIAQRQQEALRLYRKGK